MAFEPKNKTEMAAAKLLAKQVRKKKLTDKINKLKINALVIVMFPLGLIIVQFTLTITQTGIDILFNCLLIFYLFLAIWTSERINALCQLFIEKIEEE